MAPDLGPEDKGRELMLKKLGGVSVVTGLGPALQRYMSRLEVAWEPPLRDQTPQEQAEELLQAAKHAYNVVRDKFLKEYETAFTTRQRIRIFKRFAKGEPYVLHDPLIIALLIRAQEEGNRSEEDGIMASTRPKRPRRGRNSKLVQEYDRSVISTINEGLISRKTEVEAEVNRILRADKVDTKRVDAKRTSAGLPVYGYHRVRKIYYEKRDPFCWRVIVMAGLNLIKPQETLGRTSSEA